MPGRRIPIAAALTFLYVALAAAPMAVAVIGPTPPPRGYAVELGVALGFVALGMMAVQFLLTARFRWVSRRIGQDTLLQFHRVTGILAAAFVAGHVLVLVTVDPAFRAFFDPRVNVMRAAALSAASAALLLVIGLSVLRTRLGIPYEWWRLAHGLLSALVMLVAAAHVVMVGRYAGSLLQAAWLVLFAAVPLGLLAYIRVFKPWMAARRPYHVTEIEKILPRLWRVALEPVGHGGMSFEAGQFAWVTFGGSPWSIRQHPFTISSSVSNPARVEFAIKELGDFTSTIGSIRRCSTVYLEGPAGNFLLPKDAAGALLVAGGIGITPMMSILRTMRDQGDPRPVVLVHGVDSLDLAFFAEECVGLERLLDFKAVCVPRDPPRGWGGASGVVTREVLEHALDGRGLRGWEVLVCGPDPMMDAVERAVIGMGADPSRVRSERFSVV